MFNVCPNCGLYRVDKTVSEPLTSVQAPNPERPIEVHARLETAIAACPHCGHLHPFLRLPLLLVGGASATGKSAILQELTGQFTAAVLLESDLLWLKEFEDPTGGHRRFSETWLRMAKNINQSGRPTVLFGAGLAVPANIEQCEERRYFSQTHYLALVCDEEALRRRLLARPAWRKSNEPEQLKAQIEFNRWLQAEGPKKTPQVTILDTTDASVADSARAVREWMERALTTEAPHVE
ncbi:MAG: hypothetical protein F4047_16365 [Caldilineaceae bacterium SB0670_bin_27]|uniref:Nucleoside kinase n=1 Tax=Caldilineaceae bacterium SB0664_bin_27 TaxID=2605260 RepID=A0A6B0YPT6_9CHLR|nr:hypothetical protein [Caldilineaceae bacterium SB0664_bin_27]MYJ79678.1 hypothetical protein [Caldilineaceae bacterium SB0670_bin_27]